MRESMVFILLVFVSGIVASGQETSFKGKRMLVYTKTGEGYVHENITASVKAIRQICDHEEIICDVSNDPTVMTDQNLEKYDVLFFANASNTVFENQAQRDAFQRFCRNGKGFGGIHAANTAERDWPWFVQLIGGRFVRHPKFQAFDVVVVDPSHPSTKLYPNDGRWKMNVTFLTSLILTYIFC